MTLDENLTQIAGEMERIANRLEEPMTQPWKQLLGELREMNQHLKDISTEIYHISERLKKS